MSGGSFEPVLPPTPRPRVAWLIAPFHPLMTFPAAAAHGKTASLTQGEAE